MVHMTSYESIIKMQKTEHKKRARNLNRHLTKENNGIGNKHVVVVI